MMLFSATIPPWLKKLSQKYMKPSRVVINLINLAETQASSSVVHYALPCAFGMSVGTVGDVVSVYGGRHSRTIIFCETKA
jgi:ATP-dependent RNA helicase DDX21